MSADPRRNADLAAIHIAKKALALDEETYRAMLMHVSGHDSAAELGPRERVLVIAHLRSRGGFRSQPDGPHPRPLPGQGEGTERVDRNRTRRMAEGMWAELGRLGIVRNPSVRALDAMCKRVAGVDSVRFAGPRELARLIEALKAMRQRASVPSH